MGVVILLSCVTGYLTFLALRLGLHQRLPVALGRISLDTIPDRAAARHRERPLFTTRLECAWTVPALRTRYPDPRVWSASRVRDTAAYVATLLQCRFDLRPGERVAVLKENHLDIQVLIAGVVRAGGVACPMNGRLSVNTIGPYLTNIGARILFSDTPTVMRVLDSGAVLGPVEEVILTDAGLAGRTGESERLAELMNGHQGFRTVCLEEALRSVREGNAPTPRGSGEVLYIVHSSGTTGFPKGTALTNGAQSHAVRGWVCYVHVERQRDRGYMAVPHNHQAVILTFNSLLALGLRAHCDEAFDREGFDSERVVRELAEGRFTGYFGFPVTYTQLKEVQLESHDLRRMRFWGSTADATHETVARRFVRVGGFFRDLGLPFKGSVFLDAQGSSEVGTPSVLRYITRFTRRFGRRVGRPGSVPFGPQVRVTGPDGRPARRGVGRLEVRGKTLFAGYWNQDALTRRAYNGDWFFTGDVVRRGKDGHVIQLDREVDVIHTRHGPVYSLPIEEEIHRHPAVFDTCVYGERQPEGGQRPVAAVALRNGHTPSADMLCRELNRRLGPDQILHRVDILLWSEFPMGVTGKTLKRVFREKSSLATSGAESAG